MNYIGERKAKEILIWDDYLPIDTEKYFSTQGK